MLVVLMMTGLLAGMVLPRIHKVFTAYEQAEQRKSLMIVLHRLGYQAYAMGRDLQLEGNYLRSGQEDMSNLLALPQGWKIRTSSTIAFSANGTCSGGRLDLIDPFGMVEQFEVRAPVCRLDRLKEAE